MSDTHHQSISEENTTDEQEAPITQSNHGVDTDSTGELEEATKESEVKEDNEKKKESEERVKKEREKKKMEDIDKEDDAIEEELQQEYPLVDLAEEQALEGQQEEEEIKSEENEQNEVGKILEEQKKGKEQDGKEEESKVYEGESEVEKHRHDKEQVEEGEGEEPEQEEDDDDFGSFDEASLQEYQAPEQIKLTGEFSGAILNDPAKFSERLEKVLDHIFSSKETAAEIEKNSQLLTTNAAEYIQSFSTLPRLNPPNWTRLKTRHGLLLALGVPINLDELESQVATSSRPLSKRRSFTENDINWGDFEVPDLDLLDISSEKKLELLADTLTILSKIEDDNLTNTTEQFLLLSLQDVVDRKLRQLQGNHALLVELSSVWQAQIKELRSSQELFESVVQNMVGYRQKLQRNKILENIKTKKGKRVF